MAVNLVDRGHGDPAIIFIHGFTCSLSDWKEQLPSLSESNRCVAIDLPGHGDSGAAREVSIEALAAAVNGGGRTIETVCIGVTFTFDNLDKVKSISGISIWIRTREDAQKKERTAAPPIHNSGI